MAESRSLAVMGGGQTQSGPRADENMVTVTVLIVAAFAARLGKLEGEDVASAEGVAVTFKKDMGGRVGTNMLSKK